MVQWKQLPPYESPFVIMGFESVSYGALSALISVVCNTPIGSINAVLIDSIDAAGIVVFETHDTHLLFHVDNSIEVIVYIYLW
jgi:hypothetical protein